MSLKKTLADYFTFSRKDRIGIIALVSIILLIIYIPHFFSGPAEPKFIKVDTSILYLVKEKTKKSSLYSKSDVEDQSKLLYQPDYPNTEGANSPITLFWFDPNTLSVEGWKKLGLPEKTAHTIHNYRQKGGRFYKPEDLKKIWGLPESFYERVAGYIDLPIQPAYSTQYPAPDSKPHEQKSVKTIIIDINEADTASFIELPGIGSKLASRIIHFREKLGGFNSIEQIGETYGLPDSVFQRIKKYMVVNSNKVYKINLNTATKDELQSHPYVKWQLANAIIEYRKQHGPLKSLDDLKKIIILDQVTYDKMAPYLKTE